ncbi:unnamed protein product [Blepharisma stoltei]|uniref:Uncharacterized protein n=1 Tax=Blepharisma stoltei TaxID=1481888 RepID=A0AAU9IRR5_9CILI|nr:unnamed protein product [Blepharisma stoltei]
MGEEDQRNLEKSIQDLCVLIHTEFGTMGEENPFGVGITEVIHMDSFQALASIMNITDGLLDIKKQARGTPEYQQFLDNETYQRALQKLENEVRNHIKIEQQMKLYIDSMTEKLEKSEKKQKGLTQSNNKVVDQLRQDTETLKELIELRKKEVQDLKMSSSGKIKLPTTDRPMSRTMAKREEKSAEHEQRNSRLQQEWKRLKGTLAEKQKEYQKHVVELDKLQEALTSVNEPTLEEEQKLTDYYKRKYEEKCLEAAQIQNKLKRLQIYEKAPVKKQKSISPIPSTNSRKRGEEQPLYKMISNSRSSNNLQRVTSVEKLRTDRVPVAIKQRVQMSYTSRK